MSRLKPRPTNRLPHRQLQFRDQPPRGRVIFLPVVVFSPGVETPVGKRDPARSLVIALFHEYRTEIARPAAIGGHDEKVHGGEVRAASGEDAASLFPVVAAV